MNRTCCRKQWNVAIDSASLNKETSSLYTLMSSPLLCACQKPTTPCPFKLPLLMMILSSRCASSKTCFASEPGERKLYCYVYVNGYWYTHKVIWFVLFSWCNKNDTYSLVVEDPWIASVRVFPPELPHIEERLPVDEVHQPVQIVTFKHTSAQKLRRNCSMNIEPGENKDKYQYAYLQTQWYQ